MDQCTQMEPMLTMWVDGALDGDDADRVAAHVAVCADCADVASRERFARQLLRDRRGALTASGAPDELVARLRGLAPPAGASVRVSWRRPLVAIAATLLLATSGVSLHVATGRSTTVLAAQLVADHAKCHLTEHVEASLTPGVAEERLAARYGFVVTVPPGALGGRLELVGARRCLTGEGTNAHILYRFGGRAVSLYLLPRDGRPDQSLEMFGERTQVWTRHNGTYVLVADAGVEGLADLVDYMQQATR